MKFTVFYMDFSECNSFGNISNLYYRVVVSHLALMIASGQCGTEVVVEVVEAGAEVNLHNMVLCVNLWPHNILSSCRVDNLL